MLIPDHDYTERERTVCEILRPLEGCRTMLNIGMRNPNDPRNLWWLHICHANGIEPHVLEIFEPNVVSLRSEGIPNVTHGDVRDAASIYDNWFDIGLWWHGPEHLEMDESARSIAMLAAICRRGIILGCPLGEAPQDAIGDNEAERHLSQWTEDDFHAFGLETTVVADTYPAHITAWKVFA